MVATTTTLGAGPAALGIIEGVAEMTASLLKLVSGAWSDRTGRKKPLVLAGYSLSTVMRPLVGFATAWGHLLAVRFSDRIGKGIRTSPRDALIAASTPAGDRGRAFGLQRSMDHLGAVIGPLVAFLLLSGAGLSYRTVFFLSAVPGTAALAVLLLYVREPKAPAPAAAAGFSAPAGVHKRSLSAAARLREHVAQQSLELARADRPAEELLRYVGQLVRFVDDDGIGSRQQLAEARILEREIGEQFEDSKPKAVFAAKASGTSPRKSR